MKRLLSFSAVFASLLLAAPALGAQERPRIPLDEDPIVDDGVRGSLQEAAAVYARIDIYVAEGRYEMVVAEFQKILDLGLESEHEKLVAQAAWQIAEKLRAARRYAIAHEILDRTLARTASGDSCFSLNMLKAKVYQEQKLFRQAIASVGVADRCRGSDPR